MRLTRCRKAFGPLILLGFSACVSGVDSSIEKAQFLLDDGNFAEAVAEARKAVAADPASVDAAFVLGSALLGGAIAADSSTCAVDPNYPDGNDGYLGLVACLQEDPGSGESDAQTFLRIAPATTSSLSELEEATDLLESTGVGINAEHPRYKDIYLQLYVARLFEIASAMTRIGAKSDDNACNATGDATQIDGVPDSFNANALAGTEAERYRENVETVGSDGQKAGLPADFALSDRIISMGDNLSGAIEAQAGDVDLGTQDHFNDQYSIPADLAAACVAKP